MCVYNMRVAPGTHPSVGSYLWMECSHHQEFQLPFGNLRLSRLFFLYFNFQNTKLGSLQKTVLFGTKGPNVTLCGCGGGPKHYKSQFLWPI